MEQWTRSNWEQHCVLDLAWAWDPAWMSLAGLQKARRRDLPMETQTVNNWAQQRPAVGLALAWVLAWEVEELASSDR